MRERTHRISVTTGSCWGNSWDMEECDMTSVAAGVGVAEDVAVAVADVAINIRL